MKILRQPYPYFFRNKRMVKMAGFIFVILFIFLATFKPFKVEETEHRFPFIITTLIQSLCSIIVFILTIGTFNLFVKTTKIEENWTVLKEIGLLSMVFFCIGVGNFLIRNVIYNNPNNLSMDYFLEEVSHTFLIGFLLTVIFTLTNTELLTRLHKKLAEQVTKKPRTTTSIDSEIFVETKNEAENFTLSINQFLFAKADGNYVEFYLTVEEKVQKKLCRITLTQIEEQLAGFSTVARTHRAYLVNTQHIKKVQGNAQGLQLSLDAVPEKIPVSRGQIAAFKQSMNG